MKILGIALKNCYIELTLNEADEVISLAEKMFITESCENFKDASVCIYNAEIACIGSSYMCRYQEDETECSSVEDVCAWLMDVAGKCIMENLTRNEFILHAAAVKMKEKVVLFVGNPGSGKTTLAFLMSKKSGISLMGDEYIHIDFKNCRAYGDNYPLHLKDGNDFQDMIRISGAVRTRSGFQGKNGYALSVNIENKPEQIGMIIYPHYSHEIIPTSYIKMSVNDIPVNILENVAGAERSSEKLRKMITMISENRIPVMELHYSDTESAFERIGILMENKMRK